MRIHLIVDWDTINKLEDVGAQLKISTKDRSKLIKSLCDKTTGLYKDLKVLLDSLLPFLEENSYDQSDIAKLSLKIYRAHFKSS